MVKSFLLWVLKVMVDTLKDVTNGLPIKFNPWMQMKSQLMLNILGLENNATGLQMIEVWKKSG